MKSERLLTLEVVWKTAGTTISLVWSDMVGGYTNTPFSKVLLDDPLRLSFSQEPQGLEKQGSCMTTHVSFMMTTCGLIRVPGGSMVTRGKGLPYSTISGAISLLRPSSSVWIDIPSGSQSREDLDIGSPTRSLSPLMYHGLNGTPTRSEPQEMPSDEEFMFYMSQ